MTRMIRMRMCLIGHVHVHLMPLVVHGHPRPGRGIMHLAHGCILLFCIHPHGMTAMG